MLRFGSRNDVNTTFKCTVRLLEDTEVLELEFQVSTRFQPVFGGKRCLFFSYFTSTTVGYLVNYLGGTPL